MRRITLLLFFLQLFYFWGFSQNNMIAIRCDAIDNEEPVINIFIDAQQQVWASTPKNLYRIYDPDLGEPVQLKAGEQSLLQLPDGNSDIRWQNKDLNALMGGEQTLSVGFYEADKDFLWIGTREAGLFQLKTQPKLALVNQYNTKNSKLKSNTILTIIKGSEGRLWVGTNAGVLVGSDGKWKLMEDDLIATQIAERKGEKWVLSEGEIFIADEKDKWFVYDIETDLLEGSIKDIAFNKDGIMWIASEVITRVNIRTNESRIFGPADYYTSQYASFITSGEGITAWVGTKDKGLYLIDKEKAITVSCILENPLSCEGDQQDGIVRVRTVGGIPPYDYEWSNGAKTDRLENLGPGEYSVTVTDDKGKKESAQILLEDGKMTLNIVQEKEASSEEANDAVAFVSVEGGTPTYSYSWDTGEEAPRATKLATGPHSVTVTDGNGCSASASITISKKIEALSASIELINAISCPTENDAVIKVNVSGGVAPFNYAWNNASITGAQPKDIAPGSYQLTVTDAQGTTATSDIDIQEPAAIDLTTSPESPASTNNQDGIAVVEVKGGTAPYSYKWDNNETTQKATRLGPGEHTVIVTDANGCKNTGIVTMTEDILPLSITLEEASPLKCAGESTASVTARVKGGKKPYNFDWNNPGGLTANSVPELTIENLPAGEFQITVTDVEGTTATAKLEIGSPKPLTLSVKPIAPASTNNADGKATAKAAGGTAPFSYQWDNGEKTDKATALAPGTHTVTITDANGCTTTGNTEITEDILPLSLDLEQKAEILCAGDQTASVVATVSGGKPPFEFKWKDEKLSGNLAENLAAGTYSAAVTDAAGIKVSALIEIEEPQALTAKARVLASANTNSADGQAAVQVNGGTKPYKFQWDNGEKSEKASKLAPGLRTVTVTDANGCSLSSEIEITEDILPLSVNIEQKAEILCAGDQTASLLATVSGGKEPFDFSWKDSKLVGAQPENLAAGTYSLTITDAAGTEASAVIEVEAPQALTAKARVIAAANTNSADGQAAVQVNGGTKPYKFQWDNGEKSEKASKLAPGLRTVTVTDANGCSLSSEIEITEDILPLSVNIEQKAEILCAGDQTAALIATVSGGKGPFQYSWNDAKLIGDQPKDIAAGSYSLSVTDATGTQTSAQITIEAPIELTAEGQVVAPASTNNSDGQANILVSGGKKPYIFKWDNGETNLQAIKLAPGTHSVTVTDANGCQQTASVEISENILPLAVSVYSTNDILCAGSATANLKVDVSGGKSPFQYKWSDGKLQGDAPQNVPAGTYEVSVTDAAGTEVTGSVNITEPVPFEVSIEDQRPATYENSKDGKATLKVSGGKSPFQYSWSNGETGAEASALPIGTHTITVTDANKCTAETSVEITKRILPELSFNQLQEGQAIRMQKVQFEADSFRVTPQSVPVLNEVGEFLKDNPNIVVEIGGHTNGIPEHDFCDWLSTERAKAVAEYIVQERGIEGNRVYYNGYGKRQPLATNRTPEGRARNQRVEIKILSMKGILDNN